MATFNGKVVVVTGAASGIGLATATLLAKRGAKVAIADQSEKVHDVAENIKKETGNQDVISSTVEVRKTGSVNTWISEVLQKLNTDTIHGAANIAGVYKANIEGVIQEDESNWQFMLDVNLTGLMHCMRAQLPHMKAGASIVNAASVLSLKGWNGAAAYSSSKHGVVGLTKSAAREVGKDGIRVNSIAPGFIETPMLASAPKTADNAAGANVHPLGRAGKPEEVATVIAFLLSDEASFVTGVNLSVDGGMIC